MNNFVDGNMVTFLFIMWEHRLEFTIGQNWTVNVSFTRVSVYYAILFLIATLEATIISKEVWILKNEEVAGGERTVQ